MFGNRRLIKHVIETIKVVDLNLCELQCYHQPNCVSINFNIIPDSEGRHECELNNATHRSHDNELMNKDGYVYKGAEVLHLSLLLSLTEKKNHKVIIIIIIIIIIIVIIVVKMIPYSSPGLCHCLCSASGMSFCLDSCSC